MLKKEERVLSEKNKAQDKKMRQESFDNAKRIAKKVMKANGKIEVHNENVNTNKKVKKDFSIYNIDKLTMEGIKYGFIFIFVILSIYVCFATMFIYQTNDVMDRSVKAMKEHSKLILNDYYSTMNSLSREENISLLENIVTQSSSNNVYNELRKVLIDLLQCDQIYFMNSKNELYHLTSRSNNQISKDSEVYKFLIERKNADETDATSDWIYEKYQEKYEKIISHTITNSNGQFLGIIAMEIDPYAKETIFGQITQALKDVNVSAYANGIKIYTNNNNFNSDKYIFKGKDDSSVLDTFNAKDSPSKMLSKDISREEHLAKKKAENKNKYDGLLENICGQLYEVFDFTGEGTIANSAQVNYFDDIDVYVVTGFRDFFIDGLRHLAFGAGVLFVIVLLVSYLITINNDFDSKYVKIIGALYIVSIIVEVMILTIVYTGLIKDVRDREITADALLLEHQIESNFDVEDTIRYAFANIYKNVSDEELDKMNEVLLPYVQYSSKYEVISTSLGLNNRIGKYFDNFTTLQNEIAQKTRKYINYKEDDNKLEIYEYYFLTINDYDLIFKILYQVDNNTIDYKIAKNVTSPRVYLNYDNNMYLFDENKIKIDAKLKLDELTQFDKNIFISSNKRRTIAVLNENTYNNSFVLAYKSGLTKAERIVLFIDILIGIAGIYYISKSITSSEINDTGIRDMSAVYGETVFMKAEELNKAFALEEEKKKIKQEGSMIFDDSFNYIMLKRKKKNQEILLKNTIDNETNVDYDKNKTVKGLSIFKSNKEIYEDYIVYQIQDSEKKNLNNIQGRPKYQNNQEADTPTNIIEKVTTTLGEALQKLQEKIESRQANKTLADSYRDKLKEANLDKPQGQKVDNYEKVLAEKYRDAKK